MMPRTSHKTIGLQMQIHGAKEFPHILFGSNQEKLMKSISLEPGHEYVINLDPYGQISTEDFKSMSLEKRQCQLESEVFEHSTHPIYTKGNCKFDCHVDLAYDTCKCIPWDFVSKYQDAAECDIFGRTCFFNMVEMLTHESNLNCTHCIEECDNIKYRKSNIQSESLSFETIHPYQVCNKYICINPFHK